MTGGGTRMEKDSMGEMSVPELALYGASTQRAVLNFPISGYRFSRPFIRALGLIKWAAAQANHDLGLLNSERAALIVQAAEEVVDGKLDEHFPLDIFQTGSGTSTNTNANEVIANRCAQLAGKPIGSRDLVHPNDHVNMGQSSNDVIPSAIHISGAEQLKDFLGPALEKLQGALEAKVEEFWEIIKIGRTHLMDATPVRLGQEFSGYAQQIAYARARARKSGRSFARARARGHGGRNRVEPTCRSSRKNDTAYRATNRDCILRSEKSFRSARRQKTRWWKRAVSLKRSLSVCSRSLTTSACSAADRAAASARFNFPATQPGSSIMPGKVNPVMCESMMMVCAQVIGNDAAITWSGANGNFELNVMMPVMAHDLLESIRLLANVVDVFCENCVTGIKANKARCEELVELSMAMVTGLAPKIGYDRAAEIAKESAKTGKTVREICLEKKILPKDELDRALDPVSMTKPGALD